MLILIDAGLHLNVETFLLLSRRQLSRWLVKVFSESFGILLTLPAHETLWCRILPSTYYDTGVKTSIPLFRWFSHVTTRQIWVYLIIIILWRRENSELNRHRETRTHWPWLSFDDVPNHIFFFTPNGARTSLWSIWPEHGRSIDVISIVSDKPCFQLMTAPLNWRHMPALWGWLWMRSDSSEGCWPFSDVGVVLQATPYNVVNSV